MLVWFKCGQDQVEAEGERLVGSSGENGQTVTEKGETSNLFSSNRKLFIKVHRTF